MKDLFIHKIVDIERLKKSLELNLLVGSGLWQDEQGLQKKLVKINTSLVYRQDKYNLLREETEGYSKLLTVLSGMPPPPEDPSDHITNVFSVIGMLIVPVFVSFFHLKNSFDCQVILIWIQIESWI